MFKLLKYIYCTFIFKPLAGGNGVIQMDELVKAVLVIQLISASVKEGRGVEQLYPDIFWIMSFAGVFAIAAIKPVFSKYGPQKTPANP
jgi:hypothetical protein